MAAINVCAPSPRPSVLLTGFPMPQVNYMALTTGKKRAENGSLLEDLCPEDGDSMAPPKFRQAPTKLKYLKL
jgi:hypothetical protein